MATSLQIGLVAIIAVAALVSGVFFASNSLTGMTDATAELHADDNNHADGMPSSDMEKISQYAGQKLRDTKSLSDKDIQSLQNGTGEAFDGMAKLAELNGYPGPRHVLDMASELQLTDSQRTEIEFIYQDMSSKAKSIGAAIIAIEHNMDRAFANKTMTAENLELMLDKSAHLYGQLRFVHLSAHLDTMQVLTTEQVHMYNNMRGYDDSDDNNHQHLMR